MKMKNGVKREREKQNGFKSKEERCEQIQADHELFLQAFESKSLSNSLLLKYWFIFVPRANTDLQIPEDQEPYLPDIPQQESHLHEEEDVEE